jgi:hypothetical protein
VQLEAREAAGEASTEPGVVTMCQATTKAGNRCRRKGEPFCPAHADAVRRTNREAFDDLVAGLRRRDAVIAPSPLVELGATLAGDMDRGEWVACSECGHGIPVGRNAALVKQYREIVERLAADDSRDDDADIWEQFHNAGRRS